MRQHPMILGAAAAMALMSAGGVVAIPDRRPRPTPGKGPITVPRPSPGTRGPTASVLRGGWPSAAAGGAITHKRRPVLSPRDAERVRLAEQKRARKAAKARANAGWSDQFVQDLNRRIRESDAVSGAMLRWNPATLRLTITDPTLTGAVHSWLRPEWRALEGDVEGALCNRPDILGANPCAGIIQDVVAEEGCSCWRSAPCYSCMTRRPACPVCGWDMGAPE